MPLEALEACCGRRNRCPARRPVRLNSPSCVSATAASPEAIARYEAIRPVLKGERSRRQQSHQTGMNYGRRWRDLPRFRHDGLLGLSDRRTLPHARGQPAVPDVWPRHLQQHLGRLAIAPPFTARELGRLVRDGYGSLVDHRGLQRGLDQHHLSPAVLPRHHHRAAQVPARPWPSEEPLGLPSEPTTQAQRLAHALGPEHLGLRFRTYRAYPTDEQARGRIIERLAVGFRPRRGAARLEIAPQVVSHWQRRFRADGLLGLSTGPRARTSSSTRVSVQVMREVFQLLANHPL